MYKDNKCSKIWNSFYRILNVLISILFELLSIVSSFMLVIALLLVFLDQFCSILSVWKIVGASMDEHYKLIL